MIEYYYKSVVKFIIDYKEIRYLSIEYKIWEKGVKKNQNL